MSGFRRLLFLLADSGRAQTGPPPRTSSHFPRTGSGGHSRKRRRSVVATEKNTADGVESTNSFTVGKQTTGYDVELAKNKKE